MSDTEPSSAGRRWARPRVLVPVGLGSLALIVAALLAFEPWTLVTDEVVDEALPPLTGSPIPGPPPSASPTRASSTPSPVASAEPDPTPSPVATPAKSQPPAAEPTVLAEGEFISHEHATSGGVRVLTLADGTRVLRIEGLDTSNGPDLHVWITDAPVIDGRDGWFVFDDGAYVDLGALKGNQGNQNYALPASVDLDALTSVSIWCQRFRVSFGAAVLS